MRKKGIGIILVIIGLLNPLLRPLPAFSQEKPKIKAPEGTKRERTRQPVYTPDEILVKFKQTPQVEFEKEISFSVPFSAEKILFREAGWSVLGMEGVTQLNKKYQVNSVQAIGKIGVFSQIARIRLPAGADLEKVLDDYRQDKDVVYTEPNYYYQLLWVPNDPYFSQIPGDDPENYFQWNLARINMPQAWDFEPRGGSMEIKVAVVDTGIAFENHTSGGKEFAQAPELAHLNFIAPKQIRGLECDEYCWDCETLDEPINNNHPNDDNGHGTHVAGTIAQMTNNASHATGIAFNTAIIPVKVLDHCGYGLESDIASGIEHALTNGAKVINLSIGGPEAQVIHDAIKAANAAGVVVVAAAGNSFGPPLEYPAAYPETIAVGATRWDNRKADYSSYGVGLDLVAPGGQLPVDDMSGFLDQNNDLLPDGIVQQTIKEESFTQFTAVTEPEYYGDLYYRCLKFYETPYGLILWIDYDCGVYEGTSMATPHVAAAAALLFSIDPRLGPEEVRNILKSSANSSIIPNYSENRYGAGLLDVAAALGQISSPAATPTTTPSPTLTPTPPPGDINLDGFVNATDAGELFSHYRQATWPATLAPDPDGDGVVSLHDFGSVIVWWGWHLLALLRKRVF